MTRRKCPECGSLYEDEAGPCSHSVRADPPVRDRTAIDPPPEPGRSRVRHGGTSPRPAPTPEPPEPRRRRRADPTPPVSTPTPIPAPVPAPTPPPAPAAPPAPPAGYRSFGPIVRIDGSVVSDVRAIETSGPSHWIDRVPMLVFVAMILLSLPFLIRAVMPLLFLLAAILIIPMLIAPRLGGCLPALLGGLMPRGRRAPTPRPELHFRVRADGPGGETRDVVVPGLRSGVELGDPVRIVALAARGPLPVLTMTSEASSTTFWRPNLIGLGLSLVFATLTIVSLIGSGR